MGGIVATASAATEQSGITASIGATTVFTTAHDGMYRISAYAVFTAVVTPGTLTLNAIYTDPVQAQTKAINRDAVSAYTAAGSQVDGEMVFYAQQSTLIRYSTTLTGTATYAIYVRVESLS